MIVYFLETWGTFRPLPKDKKKNVKSRGLFWAVGFPPRLSRPAKNSPISQSLAIWLKASKKKHESRASPLSIDSPSFFEVELKKKKKTKKEGEEEGEEKGLGGREKTGGDYLSPSSIFLSSHKRGFGANAGGLTFTFLAAALLHSLSWGLFRDRQNHASFFLFSAIFFQ